MTNDEIKKFIAEHIVQNVSLSKIQDALLAEKGVKLTFMEVRMIAAELDAEDLQKLDKPEPKKKEEPAAPAAENPQDKMPEEDITDDLNAADEAPLPENNGAVRGNTTVEISKLVKPGTMMNGSVSFGSGVTADWYLDELGRIGLSNVKGGKPDDMDIQEFQLELRKKLGA